MTTRKQQKDQPEAVEVAVESTASFDLGDPPFPDKEPGISYPSLDGGSEASTEKKKERPRLAIGDGVALMTRVVFNLIASRKGEHWKLTNDEITDLSEVSEEVILEYLPDAQMSPIWVLAGVSATILTPRILTDMENEQKQQEKEVQGEEVSQDAQSQ